MWACSRTGRSDSISAASRRPHGACTATRARSNPTSVRFADGFQAPPSRLLRLRDSPGRVVPHRRLAMQGAAVRRPPAAFEGTQVLGTGIAGNYSNNNTWSSTTSPARHRPHRPAPSILTFRMRSIPKARATTAAMYRSASTAARPTPSSPASLPAYAANIAGKLRLGRPPGGAGWQAAQADLSAYAGHVVRPASALAFQSDSSGTFRAFTRRPLRSDPRRCQRGDGVTARSAQGHAVGGLARSSQCG